MCMFHCFFSCYCDHRNLHLLTPSFPTRRCSYLSQLEDVLGVGIYFENRPGGSGTIGASMIMEAEPDGYTIGVVPSEVLTYQPLVHSDLAYQTPDDYQPIIKLGNRPSVLFVRADAPWETFDDFRSEEHTSELQSLMRISYAVF